MGVTVYCPACQEKARIPDDAVGRTMRCRKCHRPFLATTGRVTERRPIDWSRVLLFLAAGVFVVLVVLLVVLRVTGVI